jgi:hypothetical protein
MCAATHEEAISKVGEARYQDSRIIIVDSAALHADVSFMVVIGNLLPTQMGTAVTTEIQR